MLNDLVTLERGMASLGATVIGRHPDVKDMAKGRALRIQLHSDGHIVNVEILDTARGAFWTLRDGQHNGFPGLKTASGLLSMDEEDSREHSQIWENGKTAISRRTELIRLFASFPSDGEQIRNWPNAGHRRRIGERLEALQPLSDNPITAAVPAVFQRFLSSINSSPSFLEGLIAALATRVRTGGDEWLEPVRAALIGPVALVVDTPDTEFPRDACDPRQVGPVSDALNAVDSERSIGKCALSGKAGRLHSGNFPQPNLPGLGQTYLFSRNQDIPSLTRYGRTAGASFPVDCNVIVRLSGAISELTREDAKDRKWRLIPPEKGDKQDLLIATISSDPNLALAKAIAGDDEGEGAGESIWSELGSRVIAQSKGILVHEFPQEEVVILVLRAVDPANRKVIYHRSTSTTALFGAAERWQIATANVPEWLGFRLPVKAQSELAFCKPPSMAPLSITRLSCVQFANGGRRRVGVVGVSATEAFGQFLGDGNLESRARMVLGEILRRHGMLLSRLTEARTKGLEYLKDFDPRIDLRRDALRSVTWIGALLCRLGRQKGEYMSDVAFRLGQFLAIADTIHIGYCNDLRGGDVPPRLIGNSVLAVAGSDPARALSNLRLRLRPYLSWAKRADAIFAKAAEEERKGNKSRAIALRQGTSHARRAEEIAEDLHTNLAPYLGRTQIPDEAFKAELLLGYVAGLPKKASGAALNGATESEGSINKNENEGDMQ